MNNEPRFPRGNQNYHIDNVHVDDIYQTPLEWSSENSQQEDIEKEMEEAENLLRGGVSVYKGSHFVDLEDVSSLLVEENSFDEALLEAVRKDPTGKLAQLFYKSCHWLIEDLYDQ